MGVGHACTPGYSVPRPFPSLLVWENYGTWGVGISCSFCAFDVPQCREGGKQKHKGGRRMRREAEGAGNAGRLCYSGSMSSLLLGDRPHFVPL